MILPPTVTQNSVILSSCDLNPLTNDVISVVADLRYVNESESVFELKNKK